MNPREVKAVFFDAGHTLLRAHPSVGVIYAQETHKLGAAIPAPHFEQTFRDVMQTFIPEYSSNPKNRRSSDEQDASMWREITRRVYDRLPEMNAVDYETWFMTLYHRFSEPELWRFYPDAIQTLEMLRKKNLTLGVVSNWDSRLRKLVVEMGLSDLVDFVLISAEVGVRKPDSEIFQRALELAEVQPEECLHVGDLFEEDVLGAHGAGIFPVLIDRNQRGVPKTDIPMWNIQGLDELLDRLS